MFYDCFRLTKFRYQGENSVCYIRYGMQPEVLDPFSEIKMANLIPPFTKETAHAKVKKAQDLWNTKYIVTHFPPSYLVLHTMPNHTHPSPSSPISIS